MDEQDQHVTPVEAEHDFDELSLDFDELLSQEAKADEENEIKESMEEEASRPEIEEADLFDDFGDFDE